MSQYRSLSVRDKLNVFTRLRKRFTRDQSGASALEFAMISPVLLFMIIGIIQLGFALNKGATVQWVSERALRTAMLDRDVSAVELQSLIQTELATMGNRFEVDVAYTIDSAGPVAIGRLTVDYKFPIILPMMDVFYSQFSVDTSIPLP